MNEADICDIPSPKSPEQFLEYLNLLQMIDVEWAGEFLALAATLMEIKSSHAAAARPEETGRGGSHLCEELVRQLLEYKQFKEAAICSGGSRRKSR